LILYTYVYELSGADPVGISYANTHAILIASLTLIILTVIRSTSYKLTSKELKGEMSMRNKIKNNIKLFVASLLETIWAMAISAVVGISLSPIVHKSNY
jgi:hypothetical protein